MVMAISRYLWFSARRAAKGVSPYKVTTMDNISNFATSKTPKPLRFQRFVARQLVLNTNSFVFSSGFVLLVSLK